MNCKNIRLTDPSGNWEYEQLLGAKVILKSTPISNFFKNCKVNSETTNTIKDIYFRISIDGKAITIIELEELPGKFFTWRDIEIYELSPSSIYKPICGTFKAGQAICGYKVDQSPSYLEDLAKGIAIVDDIGNIIANRYVRFTGADVESIIGDNDGVTDISINGEILD